MKKFLCFVLGIVVGVSSMLFFGDYLKNIDIGEDISMLTEKITDSREDGYEKDDSDDFDSTSGWNSEDEFIDITPHLNLRAYIGDYIGFPTPDIDAVDPFREDDTIVYDMQKNGKGVLINYYGIGMQTAMSNVFITSDYGKSWDLIQENMTFLSGVADVVYIGDTIAIISSLTILPDTKIYISTNNGKDFYQADDSSSSLFSQIIGESSEHYISAVPLILSKNDDNNTVLCAWFRKRFDDNNSSDLLLISEHDVTTFEITKEFYRNNTTISEMIEY